jgi:hypothetical protein
VGWHIGCGEGGGGGVFMECKTGEGLGAIKTEIEPLGLNSRHGIGKCGGVGMEESVGWCK